MTKIDISEWKPFAIGNIFDVIKGTRLTKAHMKSGDIRFIQCVVKPLASAMGI